LQLKPEADFMTKVCRGLCFALLSACFAAGGQDGAQKDNSAVNELFVLDIRAEKSAVRFGDPLELHVTLQNKGKITRSFPEGSLRLGLEYWKSWENSASTNPEVYAIVYDKGSIQIPPGNSVILQFFDNNVTCEALGPMKATYSLHFGDTTKQRTYRTTKDLLELTDPTSIANLNKATIQCEIIPSELISEIWAAQTDTGRKRLLPQISELLRLKTKVNRSMGEIGLPKNTFHWLGGYGLPLFELASRDRDPIVRQQALLAWPAIIPSVGDLNRFLDQRDKEKSRPSWAANLTKKNEKDAEKTFSRLAITALRDPDAGVRVAAINVLKEKEIAAAFRRILNCAKDSDADVRAAAMGYLDQFTEKTGAIETMAAALTDKAAQVKEAAITALEHSRTPPPRISLRRAFPSATGDIALRLMRLIFEQEDADLSKTLLIGFTGRTPAERLLAMTLIAGHIDESSLALVNLGLQDEDVLIQKAALMRLLSFPKSKAIPLLQAYSEKAPVLLQSLVQVIRLELERRSLFPFLREVSESKLSASEWLFPSQNGTVPMVSPDGQWVAYVETGWRRPGGTGGNGRTNLLSLTHAVRADGTGDRIVSDMFLTSWLADSKRIASSRDGYAAVCDLEGKPVIEFGWEWPGYVPQPESDWRTGELRAQRGVRMPHSKHLALDYNDLVSGENAAFSPEGQWFGPIWDGENAKFLDAKNQPFTIEIPEPDNWLGQLAIGSPDGKYIMLLLNSAAIINMQTRSAWIIQDMDEIPSDYEMGNWDYRKARWNPWSKDGAWCAFIRNGQVWIMKPDGSESKQITFDSTQKVFPTFSRNGKQLAYITWQPDERLHYKRLGPTDLWVVELETELAVRVTAQSSGRIYSLDWLNDSTIIFDRIEQVPLADRYHGVLKRLSLLP
jgi:hypothetical protein